MLDCTSLATASKYHPPQDEVLIGINFGLPKPQDAKVRMEPALPFTLSAWVVSIEVHGRKGLCDTKRASRNILPIHIMLGI